MNLVQEPFLLLPQTFPKIETLNLYVCACVCVCVCVCYNVSAYEFGTRTISLATTNIS